MHDALQCKEPVCSVLEGCTIQNPKKSSQLGTRNVPPVVTEIRHPIKTLVEHN